MGWFLLGFLIFLQEFPLILFLIGQFVRGYEVVKTRGQLLALLLVSQIPILGYAIVIEALGEVGFFNSLKAWFGKPVGKSSGVNSEEDEDENRKLKIRISELENEIKGLEGTIKKLEERFVFVEIRGRKAILDTKTGSIVNILERTKE